MQTLAPYQLEMLNWNVSCECMLLSTIILAFPLAVASWPHIEACRKAWPAEPCAYIAGNAMVLGTCESVCETTNCPNNLVCKPRRWTRHCDNCGGDLNTGGNRGNERPPPLPDEWERVKLLVEEVLKIVQKHAQADEKSEGNAAFGGLARLFLTYLAQILQM
ncbi:unnamed protein product [Fusarium venenatum]|uniref:Uncharacterized protein n=1 Tax=Fusarium venenatum TaxID=56646 RepID=A0A2L2TC94_9HYPO|nr:uncharacterized protein FVRRES_04210 [Fusarium venenatum]CEI67698.1 unnamed protein product [Fusarium venenatum]